MGYYEYVENAIIESGLDESVELLDILESAETTDDLEAVEEYLTERTKKHEKGEISPVVSWGMNDDNTSEEKKNRGGGIGLRNKYARWRENRAYDKLNNPKKDRTPKQTSKMIDKAATAFQRGQKEFDAGKIALGATTIAAAATGLGLGIKKMIDKVNSTPARKIAKQIKDLEKQLADVAKRCKSGDITAKEAKVETKKIEIQLRKLAKEAERIAREDAAKATNESVDIDDIQDDIFDAFESGEIDEDEVADLLELLDV